MPRKDNDSQISNLNLLMDTVKNQVQEVERHIQTLLVNYESLSKEANRVYASEKIASGSEGLDDFYHLTQVIRRNRDVAGSMLRGIKNMRPLSQFRFIEEDIAEVKPKKQRVSRKNLESIKLPPEAPGTPEVINTPTMPEVGPSNA